MLDLESVKIALQTKVDKREEAKAKIKKYRASGKKDLENFFEARYYKYGIQFDGICDFLFDLGYLAWANDENEVIVEKL